MYRLFISKRISLFAAIRDIPKYFLTTHRPFYMYGAKSVAKGFSLIELMIALVITGVLMALALPMYEDYGAKVRIADMQRYALLLTMDQDAYYEENGRFYGKNSSEKATVAVADADERGFYQYHNWSTSTGAGVVLIEIFITEDLYPDAVRGKRFIYEGHSDSFGRVTWQCVQHKASSLRMDEDYVPSDCTDLFTFPN